MITVIMSYHVTRNKCVTIIKDDILKEHFGFDAHFKDSNYNFERLRFIPKLVININLEIRIEYRQKHGMV